jgi:hypothetical protein
MFALLASGAKIASVPPEAGEMHLAAVKSNDPKPRIGLDNTQEFLWLVENNIAVSVAIILLSTVQSVSNKKPVDCHRLICCSSSNSA